MPRVLRIINRFNLGGPTYNAAYLTKFMAPEFETLLVGGYKDPTEEKSDFIIKNLGIDHVLIPEMRRQINPVMDYIAYKKIKEIIKEFKPDIVHTHASKAGSLGRRAAHKCGVPVILHTFHGHVFHSYFNPLKVKAIINVEQKLARFSDKIIAISDIQKYELSQIYKIAEPEKFKVIPLGFDLSRFNEGNELKRKKFREKYKLDDDELAIGIVGRLVPIKNHAKFLKAIKFVKENSQKKIRAFIVGDGELREELERFCNEINLDFVDWGKNNEKATVTFTSWIRNIDYVYSGVDIVALTSLNEGTPVSLIEAQASNKPIVSTNTGGIENIVLPGITAILTKNGDPVEYAEKLLSVVEDNELRIRLSQQGWEYVKDKFHYSRLVDQMKELYFDLLKSKIV